MSKTTQKPQVIATRTAGDAVDQIVYLHGSRPTPEDPDGTPSRWRVNLGVRDGAPRSYRSFKTHALARSFYDRMRPLELGEATFPASPALINLDMADRLAAACVEENRKTGRSW